uniref:Cathepsin propeptide inhibitor domain-containing protein n=1 Tax=Oryza nivara TaxID=4536 RepID=A0A0E0HG95_ORYNI
MSLRALGSLLTRRRFSPCAQAQAEAESSRGIFTQATAGRSARSLRALQRDLAVGDGGAYGVVATIALAGLATILYVNENTDKSGVQWASYLDHVNFQTHHGGMPPYDEEASAKEVSDWEEALKQQDVKVDEATMKSRFQDWMKEHNRSYSTEEEKARRYEIFKETAIRADKANACNSLYSHPGSFDWERYIDHMNTMNANEGYIGNQDVIVSEAVKKKDKELAAKYAERRRRAANNQPEKSFTILGKTA